MVSRVEPLPGDVLDAVADPVVVLDPEGRIVRFNHALEELTGYSTEDVRGRFVWDVVLRDDEAGLVRATLARLAEGQTVTSGGNHWVRRDGSVWFARWSPRAVRDAEGRVAYVVATGRLPDVAEGDLAALRRSEARYRSLVEASDELVWAVGGDLRVTFVNRLGARRLFGREADEIVGQSLDELLGDDAPGVRSVVHRVLAGERVHGHEMVLAGDPDDAVDGGHEAGTDDPDHPSVERHVLLSALPVRDQSGQVIAATGTAVDITARKEAETARERYARQLERRVAERTAALREAKEDLESFLFSISHDLRAPLRAIHLFAELLAVDHGETLDDQGCDYVGRIVRASSRMDRLILDLLAYCRVGRTELPLADVSLDEVIDDALSALAREIEVRHSDVVVDRPLPRLRANRAVLLEIVVNLLTNALKFVPSDRRPRVRIAATAHDATVRLEVVDNGEGIEPAALPRVFRLFERSHGGTVPGTGLGLAIVRRAVSRMGGAVGLESTPGAGTTAWVELPAATGARERVSGPS